MLPDEGLIVTVSIDNPYKSPEAAIAETPLGKSSEVSWKSIATRWELLRIPYNLVVGVAGLLALLFGPAVIWVDAVAGAVAYGLCANVMYLLGPITEMYFNWFVDAWESRFVPRWLAGLVRSRSLTAVLFVGGCLFSVGLTLVIGLSEAFAAALPDQP